MNAYITYPQIYAEIPQQKVNDALDDDGDGQADAGLLDAIIANACSAVDGKLGGRFATPFTAPVPAIVVQAALIFACEKIYGRREMTGQKNPYTDQANKIRDMLDLINQRKMPLDATIEEDLQAQQFSNTYVPGRLTITSD